MHKEKHAATHMSCQNIQREKMMRRDRASIKQKYISNIKVVRIYGEREKAKEWSCMHNMVGERKRREEYRRMHTCRNITWVSM